VFFGAAPRNKTAFAMSWAANCKHNVVRKLKAQKRFQKINGKGQRHWAPCNIYVSKEDGKNYLQPVVCEVPSHLSQTAAVAFFHVLRLVDSLCHVEQMLIRMFYVEVEPEGVKQQSFCLKDTFSLLL